MAVWRDISLLWLIFLTLVAVLPIGVIFFFLVKGLHRLRTLAKQTFPVVQEKAQLVADTTERASQKIAAPVIGMQAKAAHVRGIRHAVFARRKAR
jgi:hypothetical protein